VVLLHRRSIQKRYGERVWWGQGPLGTAAIAAPPKRGFPFMAVNWLKGGVRSEGVADGTAPSSLPLRFPLPRQSLGFGNLFRCHFGCDPVPGQQGLFPIMVLE
jgi:hypothetical protein